MTALDLSRLPLEGTHLIEASAGTGKTHAVAGLVLRLLVEKAIRLPRILVVTYTVAAAESLQQRIRSQLRAALRAFASGKAEDPVLQGLLAGAADPGEQRRRGERVRRALQDFDEAAIHTIHGFCQRILQEHAFASGTDFSAVMAGRQDELLDELAADFWRRHFYPASPEFAAYARSRNLRPESFRKEASFAARGDLRILPDAAPPDPRDLREATQRFRDAVDPIRRQWPAARSAVEEALSHPALKKTAYGDRVPSLLARIDGWLAGEPLFPPPDGFDKLTAERIVSETRKKASPPDHPLSGLCQAAAVAARELAALFEAHILFLRRDLFRFVQEELPLRKSRWQMVCFDDLLTGLHHALLGPGGMRLAQAVRERFQAALIDEFQDTDPVQYAIFDRLFGSPVTGHPPHLYLIGDPKQAIYSFRGADVFSYLEASRKAHCRSGLTENWRSEAGLIQAVNSLWSQGRAPFVLEEIAFVPVAPALQEQPRLWVGEGPEAPLQWWHLESEEGKRLSREEAESAAVQATVAEILRLLRLGRQGRACIGRRPVHAGDMAVLVHTNREGRRIQDALAAEGVATASHRMESVFATEDAEDLRRVLLALASPGRDDLLRAALVTDILGLNGNDVARLDEDEDLAAAWVARMQDYHEAWRERGFLPMIRWLLRREGAAVRLLSFPDGERRLTNLLHLAELLHRAAESQGLGMDGLLSWLAARRGEDAARAEEEALLRLENDDAAVHIVTIHRSKGLEYPLVFCPFAWQDAKQRQDLALFHDPEAGGRLTLDLGSDRIARSRQLAEQEALAERCRLLYVALTRAKHRCYLVWGRLKEAPGSALAYLLRRFDDPGLAPDTGEGGGDVGRRLAVLAAQGGGAIHLQPLPLPGSSFRSPQEERERESLAGRSFRGVLDQTWKVASFSLLVSPRPGAADLPERDRDGASAEGAQEEAGGAPPARTIFSFPGGTKAGILWHAILERLDFASEDPEIAAAIVREELEVHGFDLGWVPVVLETLDRVLHAPLDPLVPGLRLARISRANRVSEAAFHFPLRPLTSQTLARLLAPAVPEPMEGLSFRPLRGYMKGFLDLVFSFEGRFYLVDWKSNLLGGGIEAYRPEALERVMTRSFYRLQYLLYMVALDRHLELRLPRYDYERHFGGVLYLFLRGMDPRRKGYGIFRTRPAPAVIRTLSEGLLVGKKP